MGGISPPGLRAPRFGNSKEVETVAKANLREPISMVRQVCTLIQVWGGSPGLEGLVQTQADGKIGQAPPR